MSSTLEASSVHSIFVNLPIVGDERLKPFASDEGNIWDEQHVKIPTSPHAKVKWEKIVEALKSDISNVQSLKEAICSYNPWLESVSFRSIESYLVKTSDAERKVFFTCLLPEIIDLALSLPNLIKTAVPLLQRCKSKSLTLSQKQIGCLLANAFLCTFPDKREAGEKCGIGPYPDINFNRLFSRSEPNAVEKWKCFFNYFQRITSLSQENDGLVTFSRQFILESRFPDFDSSQSPLPTLTINESDSMIDEENHLIVDFADKYIGGMVFTKGFVQEEILFLFYPELIVARLFMEKLEEGEAVIVKGVERFNSGIGYGKTFKFTESFTSTTSKDEFRRRATGIIAIDAVSFNRRNNEQYKKEKMIRDIRKAYVGFCPLSGSDNVLPIATGNWGCGIFAGNPRLKSLLQLIAAGVACRELKFFAYGNKKLAKDLKDIHRYLVDKEVTTGDLTKALLVFNDKRNVALKGEDLYAYLKKHFK